MSAKHNDQLALAHLALIDMERVQKSIEYLKSTEDEYLKDALFRDAVVSYAKPFLNNHYSNGTKGLCISKNHIPNELENFHNEVIVIRDKLIAHTDMTLQKPRVDKYQDEMGDNYSLTVSGYENIFKDHLIDPLYKLSKAVHKSLLNGRSNQTKNAF
jgi:hypothetical protein